MDYEKLHKDTIAKLQEMVNSGKITVKTACGICADFVPESEDERIMKDIVTYLKSVIDNKGYRDKIIESWIAWLENTQYAIEHAKREGFQLGYKAGIEKQGEKIEPIEDFDTEFERQISHLIASIINKEYSYTEAFVKWTSNALLNYAKHEIEKQEQIPANSAKTCKDEQKPIKEHNVCDFCEDRYGCVNTCPTKLIDEQKPTDFSDLRTWKYIVDAVWTEKEGIGQYLDSPFTEEVAKKLQKRFGKIEQKPAEWHREDEQNLNACLGYIPDEFLRRWLMDVIHVKYDKPADKVESKFKDGDWVVYDHRVYQVVELPKEGYINLGLRRNGKLEFAPSTYCRHWTIQDAKDGDVLAYRGEQWIFIYKERKDETLIEYYALESEKGLTINSVALTVLLSCIVPATKEQRNLLFQKMKEAGYEWDAESKQLISLKAEPNGEQKPANNVETKFRKGDSIQFKGFGHNRYTIKEVCGLSHYVNTMGNSMDMSYTDANFEVIKDSDKVEISTAEWSEDDEKMLKDTIRFCELCGNQVSANWLKYLRSQSHWKPSDEQLEALKEACDEHWEPDGLDPLYTLYEQLKKLKE